MPKKIYDLAKELDLPSLELVEKLKKNGFAVRNHMSSLNDEEIEKFQMLLESEAQAKRPVKKKKASTTKKKTVKKKVAKTSKSSKVATVKSAEELKKSKKKVKVEAKAKPASKEEEEKKKKTVIRKKVVRRRKGETTGEEVGESSTALAEQTAASQATGSETDQALTADQGQNKIENKVHTFTPVYIPEKEEKPEGTQEGASAQDKDGKEEGPAKKRLADLAAMVAKPKSISKSRNLTELRAQEQLKVFQTGVMGKTIYTNVGKKKTYSGAKKKTIITEAAEHKRVIYVHNGCLATELANKVGHKFEAFRDQALDMNLLLAPNDFLGIKLADQLAKMYNYKVENAAFDETEVIENATGPQEKDLVGRDPIVTIMGHVDHGKTTLLDYIRKAKVADSEAGGITQHIGAYCVNVKNGVLTFLDTPGHAAFGAMRSRGAQVTDIVVLVVAADDGVMPQTKESIEFCKNANVPIIVAVNKMDKEGVNPDTIKQQLMEFELVPEDWGGQTAYCPISALKGQGVDELLEAILLHTEVMELKANPKGGAKGVVIESKIESGRGAVSTILVQSGTLNKSDYIVVGEHYGRVRSLTSFAGKALKKAGPSTPVQILGLGGAPNPGDVLNVVKNEREAKKIVDNRLDEKRELKASQNMRRLEDFSANSDNLLKLLVRADVQGSFEAIQNALEALGNNEVGVQIVGGGVGQISDSDVTLAASANAFILGFNMRPSTSARRMAEEMGVDVKTYSIIYELINDVTLALEGLLEPEHVEIYIGRAKVKDTFTVPKVGLVAGSAVIDGKIKTGCHIRLLRDGKIVFNGKMSSLKRFKDSVKEVANGLECGIGLDGFHDVKIDDVFEAYMLEEKKRKLQETMV